MIRSSVRSAGVALLLLTINGCGEVVSSGPASRSPGINVAEAALQGGAGQIALQVSSGILRDSPNDVRALEVKGDALVILGEYEDATAVYQALLAKDANSTRATIGLGRIKLAKDPAGAAALFDSVLKRDPRNLIALNNLGIARDLQGRHAEAQAAYRQALAINPDQESAQVNLALSMAMSGQAPAAVKMLKAKASDPGAPVKVRHDYAVVLAMAGNRPEAERVLRTDLSPDEARQMLDEATGMKTKPVREGLQDRPDTVRLATRDQRRLDDGIPPDVVQVPEVPNNGGRSATATLAPPVVVRPQHGAGPDSEAPNNQPVNPIAAAIINQRPLAAPLRPADRLAQSVQQTVPATTPAPAPGIVTPKVVAMPPVLAMPRVVPLSAPDAAAEPSPQVSAGRVPSAQGAAADATSGRTFTPAQQAALAAAGFNAQTRAAAPVHTEAAPASAAPASAAPASVAPASVAPAPVAPADAGAKASAAPAGTVAMLSPPRIPESRGDAHRPASARADTQDGPTKPAVQFAAATSEEAARAFWQNLVHKFPDALGHKQPSVVRYERDGTVFWRVRTEGFDSASEAQTLCARMRAAGQSCFVPRS